VSIRLPFRNLEPTFFSGLLDDPLLLIRVRPAGRNLLFDCGQLHHLAKRVLTPLEALFISHTHMDHWMGIDSVIRHLHAAPKTISLFGPPGLANKLQHKLAGYDWNLAEAHWGDIRVEEIFADHLVTSLFRGPEGFRCEPLGSRSRDDRIIFGNPYLKVSAESCQHRVPSLVFRIDEQPTFMIDTDRLRRLQLVPGPWLGKLKRHFFAGAGRGEGLTALKQAGEKVVEFPVSDPVELTRLLLKLQPQAAIGYISDIGSTPENMAKLIPFLQGVDLLVCECTFLRADKEKARTSFHLCSEDINQLLAELKPAFFLPMHLSKTYSRRTEELYRELEPPAETRILRIPPQRTPRPLQAREIDWQIMP